MDSWQTQSTTVLKTDVIVPQNILTQEFRKHINTKLATRMEQEKELRHKEVNFHLSLHPGVAKVLSGKNLMLLERIANDLG